MKAMTYIGGTHVATEKGESLSINSMIDRIMLPNGDRPYVKMATLDAPTNATTELVPAVADKRIFIVSMILSNGAGAATTITFKSASTAISPIISLAANGTLVVPFASCSVVRQVNVNEAINVTLSNGAAIGIIARYVEVPVDVDIP